MTSGSDSGSGSGLALIVDDRAASRAHITLELQARGHATLEAADGREGFAAFEQHRPGVVVTDVRMPRSDGFDLLERIRHVSAIPVFCVTAFPQWDCALLAMRKGATYYYRWPGDFDRLIADVDRALSASASSAPWPPPDGPRSLEAIRETSRRESAEQRRAMLERALRATGGNVGQAAELLRVSRRTIYHWMERYGVPRETG